MSKFHIVDEKNEDYQYKDLNIYICQGCRNVMADNIIKVNSKVSGGLEVLGGVIV